MTDKPTPTTDLLKRCAEIHEWRSTGVLSGEALRDYAKRKWPDLHDTLQMAEHETVTEALALLAKWGQPAHSGEPVAWLSPWRADQVTTDYDAYGERGIPLYTAPQPSPTAQADSGFDYKTAADFLNGKTVSDEAVRKFVAASRWAHDERAALSATLLAMHGVLTSREAEIALLKKALLEAEAAPQQEATKAAPGELKAHQILAITTAYEQGVGKGHQAYKSGKEIANPYDSAYGCDLAWQYGYGEGKEQAQRATKAAPQQEAQEPSHRETVDVVGVRSNGEHVNLEKIAMSPRMKAREIAIKQFGSFKDDDGSDADMCFGALEYFLEWLIQQGWSKAPQPAPAPLSEREEFERDWEKRHAPVPINGRTHDDGRYGDSSIQDAWESWQARAAIAAQGGKDA